MSPLQVSTSESAIVSTFGFNSANWQVVELHRSSPAESLYQLVFLSVTLKAITPEGVEQGRYLQHLPGLRFAFDSANWVIQRVTVGYEPFEVPAMPVVEIEAVGLD